MHRTNFLRQLWRVYGPSCDFLRSALNVNVVRNSRQARTNGKSNCESLGRVATDHTPHHTTTATATAIAIATATHHTSFEHFSISISGTDTGPLHSKWHEACTGIPRNVSCMMRTFSADKERATVNALWHSGQVRAVCTERANWTSDHCHCHCLFALPLPVRRACVSVCWYAGVVLAVLRVIVSDIDIVGTTALEQQSLTWHLLNRIQDDGDRWDHVLHPFRHRSPEWGWFWTGREL